METNERINLIIKYESGELDINETLKLFSNLIKTGMCWNLQGHYGRVASALIEQEIINKEGKILKTAEDLEE